LACGSAQTLPSTYTRVSHFRPNLDSFVSGLTYMWGDLYVSIYGNFVDAIRSKAECVMKLPSA